MNDRHDEFSKERWRWCQDLTMEILLENSPVERTWFYVVIRCIGKHFKFEFRLFLRFLRLDVTIVWSLTLFNQLQDVCRICLYRFLFSTSARNIFDIFSLRLFSPGHSFGTTFQRRDVLHYASLTNECLNESDKGKILKVKKKKKKNWFRDN